MHTNYAVVTGAGKGIGKAIALTLANSGYTVIACSRTQSDLEQLQQDNANIIPFAADLATTQGVEALGAFY
ncbi:MAG: SDR family NAD(P)-dependent oxidoreductase [Sphingobacteriales bacterium JAD_PAG50586_3]|nr:MAG: SDR family NAD(P)-dependent oxidoreductase [Sphingobacteriales bacterium JAD_PAG50586_3]